MRRLVILVCLLVFACSGLSRTEKRTQADVNYQLGLSYMKEGKFQDAFVEFQKALEFDAENKDIHNALGLIYLKFEDFDNSERAFLKALEIDPGFSDVYNSLGVVYTRKKKWDKAIKQFQNALSNPLYASPEKAYYNLGNALYRLGKYDMALKEYKNALRRVPDFFPAYYGLALCYNATEEYGEASTALMLGIRQDPEIKGKRQKAVDVFNTRMVMTVDDAEKNDYRLLMEILHY